MVFFNLSFSLWVVSVWNKSISEEICQYLKKLCHSSIYGQSILTNISYFSLTLFLSGMTRFWNLLLTGIVKKDQPQFFLSSHLHLSKYCIPKFTTGGIFNWNTFGVIIMINKLLINFIRWNQPKENVNYNFKINSNCI